MSKIDRDRGVIIRKHPGGYRVCMYVDLPGVYFDENNKPVETALAEAAGFDVAKDATLRAKNKLRSNYERQIGQKFSAAEQKIGELLEQNPNLLKELSIIEYEDGTFGIEDEDENSIVGMRLTYEEAAVLYTGITGADWEDDDESSEQENPYLDMGSKEIRALLKEAEVDVPVGLRMPVLAEFALKKLPISDEDESEEEDDASDLIG